MGMWLESLRFYSYKLDLDQLLDLYLVLMKVWKYAYGMGG